MRNLVGLLSIFLGGTIVVLVVAARILEPQRTAAEVFQENSIALPISVLLLVFGFAISTYRRPRPTGESGIDPREREVGPRRRRRRHRTGRAR